MITSQAIRKGHSPRNALHSVSSPSSQNVTVTSLSNVNKDKALGIETEKVIPLIQSRSNTSRQRWLCVRGAFRGTKGVLFRFFIMPERLPMKHRV